MKSTNNIFIVWYGKNILTSVFLLSRYFSKTLQKCVVKDMCQHFFTITCCQNANTSPFFSPSVPDTMMQTEVHWSHTFKRGYQILKMHNTHHSDNEGWRSRLQQFQGCVSDHVDAMMMRNDPLFNLNDPRISIIWFPFCILSLEIRWKGQYKWMVYGSVEQLINPQMPP